METLHHSGPLTITIRLSESDKGWRYGLDTRTRDGCGISSGRATSRPHLTRASAIASAVNWIRMEHGLVIPSADAWLDGLEPAQADMFGRVA